LETTKSSNLGNKGRSFLDLKAILLDTSANSKFSFVFSNNTIKIKLKTSIRIDRNFLGRKMI